MSIADLKTLPGLARSTSSTAKVHLLDSAGHQSGKKDLGNIEKLEGQSHLGQVRKAETMNLQDYKQIGP